jgi:hypothetical protein
LEHQRQRTKPTDIAYGLYLYFLGLSIFLIEILQKRYKGLFIVQAMSPSGNGLRRNTSQRKYLAKEKRVTSL